jgi:hypothetical protein
VRKIEGRIKHLVEHLRQDVGKVAEPKAQALFETSAEVLVGLAKAFGDYERKKEAAWKTGPGGSA